MQRLDSLEDCEDFIAGCLFMGTGGGGDYEEGMQMLTSALDDGLLLGWREPEAIDDNTLTSMVYRIGSIAPRSNTETELMRDMHLASHLEVKEDTMCLAVQALSEHLGEKIGCIVAAELGASNSPGPVVAAARLGVPVVDGDYSGRAVPEEMQSTPYAYGIPSDPFAVVDRWGNTAIVAKTVNPYMLERIARHLAVACIDGASIASTPLKARLMKRILVPGTLSQCLAIGRACRGAVASGLDPVDAALDVVGGWRLFDGVVVSKEWQDTSGFMIGMLEIEGTGASNGHHLRAWFKNEIHITWIDDRPWVCSPDLVTLINPSSGRGFTNTDIAIGDHVAAVGMRGLRVLRQPAVLVNGSGPEYFGFDVPYVPIERIMTNSSGSRCGGRV